ncbi:serine/threonine protein kinase [Paenibacillus piscarius]|uniref:serine/threonine protein kinase n=1 Tax=Paenibacillus piscarius TaxID=1089681 RepID=UPI001EE88222|nr:serine/threonine protein kinase [Paenibacillus piscarius]
MEDFKAIQVYPGIHQAGKNYQVSFYNPTSLPFIGAGAQGAVFSLNSGKCVKIYASPEDAKKEATVLSHAVSSSFFPRLFDSGFNYNVMEFVHGPGLDKYLLHHNSLNAGLAFKMIDLLEEMQCLGLTRIDAALRHIIITPSQSLVVIDHVHSMHTHSPNPLLLLADLKNLNLMSCFMEYVKFYKPDLYEYWSE